MNFKIFFSDEGNGDLNDIVKYFAAKYPALAEMVGAFAVCSCTVLGGHADYWDVDGETDEPFQAVALPVLDFLSTPPIE